MTLIKVLIVDDSATMRALIGRALSADPRILITGYAGNPIEARDMIKREQPDVITLDVEMPGMNGLEFLEKIMRLRPIPVVMVSSLTEKGADVAIRALQMGAFDCYPKQATAGRGTFDGLSDLVAAAASSTLRRRKAVFPPRSMRTHTSIPCTVSHGGNGLIAVGSSTGGVEAIEELLSGIPSDFSPIVIVQHMPALFTSSLARRLDAKSDLSIREARSGEVLKKGDVRIAPGGQMHLMVVREEGGYVTRLVPGEPVSGHRPSVDVMFDSVAQIAERETVGVILTGMGADGAKGLLAMRRAGAVTFAQDRGTSLVYGMPRVAAEMGAANRILPLCEIAPAIVRLDVNMR